MKKEGKHLIYFYNSSAEGHNETLSHYNTFEVKKMLFRVSSFIYCDLKNAREN